MELNSADGAAAFQRKQERRESRSRVSGRLVLVRGRSKPDAVAGLRSTTKESKTMEGVPTDGVEQQGQARAVKMPTAPTTSTCALSNRWSSCVLRPLRSSSWLVNVPSRLSRSIIHRDHGVWRTPPLRTVLPNTTPPGASAVLQ